MISRTVVISDLHGCLQEYRELLNLVDYKSPNVKVIQCGDQIDRGRESRECIKLSRELGITSVMGNHERKFLNWLENTGGKRAPTKFPHYEQFSKEDIEYMKAMPSYIEIPQHNTVIVHAGVRAGVSMEKQIPNDLYYIRYLDRHGKFVSLRTINRLGSKEAAGAHFWTEFGSFGFNIIFGHQVNSLTDIKIDRFEDGTACYGIDTGAVYGGQLTGYVIETKEVIQVQAKEKYYTSNFEVR